MLRLDASPPQASQVVVPPKPDMATEQCELVRRLLGHVRVVVDVGAHHGEYAMRFVCEGARIEAVEPNPISFARLAHRMMALDCVRCSPVALSSRSHRELLPLYFSCPSTLSSLERRWPEEVFKDDYHNFASTPVSVLSWRDFCALRGLVKCGLDFVKVDAEGHDIEIVGDMLNRGPRPRAFLMEVAGFGGDSRRLKTLEDCAKDLDYILAAQWTLDGARGFFDRLWVLKDEIVAAGGVPS